MQPAQIALLGLVVGLLIGAGLATVILLALRARERAEYGADMDVPEGARMVLQGLDDPAVVLDSAGVIIAASASAAPFDLTEGSMLPTAELRGVARRDVALAAGGGGSLSGGFEYCASIAAMASGALRGQFKSVSRLRGAGP